MIGLIDLDLLQSTSTTRLVPNLEIMKLAAYYRFEENTFCRLMTLNEPEIQGYDKVYIFSERPNATVPEHFRAIDNLILGGTGFTNGKYEPFSNSLIDFTLPRTSIYKDFLNNKYNDGVKYKVISHVLDDTYYRNYAGDARLPLPAILPRQRVFLYDTEFFYSDWESTLNIISERKPSSIIRIHPVICHTLTQYFTLRRYNKFNRENDIIIDLDMREKKEITYLLKTYSKQFLADIVATSNVYLPLGGNKKTNHQFFDDLIYTLNLLYSFWSYNIPIKIKYIEPITGIRNPIANLSVAIQTWSDVSLSKRKDKSIEDKIILKTKRTVMQEEQEFFLKYHPRERSLFTQTFNDLSRRRYWRYDY